jgi:hypothetical protein
MNNALHEYAMFFILVFIGLLGSGINFVVQYEKNTITCSFNDYLRNKFFSTLGSYGAICGLALGLLPGLEWVDIKTAVTMFTAGFALDNLINKAK